MPFTDRARKIIMLAHQEAQQLSHEHVDTGHLLLGAIREGTGVAAYVLRNLGVRFGEARREVENLLSAAGLGVAIVGKPSHSPGVEQVLRYSLEEARNLNHNYVGTEHILLGLLRDRDGTAGRALHGLGLEIGSVRAETLQVLGATPAPDSRSRPLPPHISVGPVGRAVLGLCAFLSSLAFGACSVALAIMLATVGPPPGVWKAILVHLLLDVTAIASIFMLLLAISFFTSRLRWIDPLLYKIMPKGVVAVIVIVALIFVAAGIVDPKLGIIMAGSFLIYTVAVAVFFLIRKRSHH